MSEQQEWGPWIEHDGRGCPCVGHYIRVQLRNGEIYEGVAGQMARANGHDPNGFGSAWVWHPLNDRSLEVVRYRIRKPRGMKTLEDILENLPETTREVQDA